MERITKKEEELMRIFWERGALFVREILDGYPEPKPHFNTLSTIVRTLETKGYLSHEAFGKNHRYYALISEEQFSQSTLKGVVSKYFQNSYMRAVSALVSEEQISVDELKELIRQIEEKQ